jgi:hypothetical protein
MDKMSSGMPHVEAVLSLVRDPALTLPFPAHDRCTIAFLKRLLLCAFRATQGFQLSEAQASVCHSFVHVDVSPALPSARVAISADMSLSITLHHFTAWAGYTPNRCVGRRQTAHMRG